MTLSILEMADFVKALFPAHEGWFDASLFPAKEVGSAICYWTNRIAVWDHLSIIIIRIYLIQSQSQKIRKYPQASESYINLDDITSSDMRQPRYQVTLIYISITLSNYEDKQFSWEGDLRKKARWKNTFWKNWSIELNFQPELNYSPMCSYNSPISLSYF